MNAKIIMTACLLVLSAVAAAQQKPQHADATKASPDKFTVLLENEYVRVIEYRLEPGEKDEWHTHPPKVSYVVSGGKLRITTENGRSFVVDELAGSAAWMGAVGLHFGENIGTTPVRIALIEIKSLADAPFEGIDRPD